MENKKDDQITFFLHEKNEVTENDDEIQKMLFDFEKEEFLEEEEEYEVYENEELYYNEACTVKDLLKICHYYGIDKNVKASKCKKQDIISTLLYFESLPENFEIVQKRNRMWAYITELSNDSKMKQFVIW
jgi:hypothetical protein